MEASTSLMSRRSLTLYDQLSIVPHHSKNLRDLLKVPESSADPCPDPNPSPNTTWRTLRDLLQLHTNRSAESEPDPNPSVSAYAEAEQPESRPVRVPLMALLEEAERNANTVAAQASEDQEASGGEETQVASVEESHGGESQSRSQANEEAMVRVSLMALLEQSERSLNWEGGEREEVAEGEGLACVCCVCMVRRKGAAFIPCGHTFCRRCSRELYLTRGTCPLCNGAIAEVLDIF